MRWAVALAMEVYVARHLGSMIPLVLGILIMPGCRGGSESTPLRLEDMFSRQTRAASAGDPTSFASTNTSPQTMGNYGVPGPSSTIGATSSRVRGTVQQTASSIKNAFTIQPRVIPAADETSLRFDPGPLRPDLFVSAAAVMEQQNRNAEATQKYEEALAIDPNHRASLVGLARLKHREGDLAGATDLPAGPPGQSSGCCAAE